MKRENRKTSKTTVTSKPQVLWNAVIEVTDHSLLQLYDRYAFNSYSHIISSEELYVYPDVDENSNVFYYNILPRGFVVLRRTEPKKFVVITITLDEHRNFGQAIKLTNPRLRERQGEYEL